MIKNLRIIWNKAKYKKTWIILKHHIKNRIKETKSYRTYQSLVINYNVNLRNQHRCSTQRKINRIANSSTMSSTQTPNMDLKNFLKDENRRICWRSSMTIMWTYRKKQRIKTRSRKKAPRETKRIKYIIAAVLIKMRIEGFWMKCHWVWVLH